MASEALKLCSVKVKVVSVVVDFLIGTIFMALKNDDVGSFVEFLKKVALLGKSSLGTAKIGAIHTPST